MKPDFNPKIVSSKEIFSEKQLREFTVCYAALALHCCCYDIYNMKIGKVINSNRVMTFNHFNHSKTLYVIAFLNVYVIIPLSQLIYVINLSLFPLSSIFSIYSCRQLIMTIQDQASWTV